MGLLITILVQLLFISIALTVVSKMNLFPIPAQIRHFFYWMTGIIAALLAILIATVVALN